MKAQNTKFTNDKEGGFALIGTVVGVLVASALMVTFVSLAIHSKKISRINSSALKANLYLREMIEAAKDLEVSNWAELKTTCTDASPCHPQVLSGKWTIAAGEEILDSGQFTRKIAIFKVCRDHLGFPNEIKQCDGVNPVDPNTKNVKAAVKWAQDGSERESELEAILYNL